MANKTTTFTLTANTLTTQAQSTATITGRTVYGHVVDVTETITQSGATPVVTDNIWIKSGTSSILVSKPDTSPRTVNSFNVVINGVSGNALEISTTNVYSPATTIPATVSSASGTSSYTISCNWFLNSTLPDPDTYVFDTTIKWKENGVQKTYTQHTGSGTTSSINITTSITVTQNTELSDFEAVIEARQLVVLKFNTGTTLVFRNSTNETQVFKSFNVVFSDGNMEVNYYYVPQNPTSVAPGGTLTLTPISYASPIVSESAITCNIVNVQFYLNAHISAGKEGVFKFTKGTGSQTSGTQTLPMIDDVSTHFDWNSSYSSGINVANVPNGVATYSSNYGTGGFEIELVSTTTNITVTGKANGSTGTTRVGVAIGGNTIMNIESTNSATVTWTTAVTSSEGSVYSVVLTNHMMGDAYLVVTSSGYKVSLTSGGSFTNSISLSTMGWSSGTTKTFYVKTSVVDNATINIRLQQTSS